jgi:D-threonate/D-erythronate kinase
VRTALAIIADDLTGGCDAGALFAGPGPVPFTIWPRTISAAAVQVIDTESRALDGREAADRVRSAAARVAAAHVFKKIDSTLRGRIGAETEAVMAAGGLSTALLCPAFPAQGRVVADRVLTVHGTPVSSTAVAGDPEFPATAPLTRRRGPDVTELLRSQFARPLAWIPLDGVRAQPESLRDRLARLAGSVVLAEAETDADLDALVDAALTAETVPLLVGSAGLAGALARRWGLLAPCAPLPRAQRILIVAGSRHPVTRCQVAAARAARLSVITTPKADCGDRAAVARNLAAEARRRIEAGGVDFVVVTGGETAVALFESLGAERIDLAGAPRPGLALGDFCIPGRAALPVLTKAGGFGDHDLFVSLATEATR